MIHTGVTIQSSRQAIPLKVAAEDSYLRDRGAAVTATLCAWIVLVRLSTPETSKKKRTLAATIIATMSKPRFSFHVGLSAS